VPADRGTGPWQARFLGQLLHAVRQLFTCPRRIKGGERCSRSLSYPLK